MTKRPSSILGVLAAAVLAPLLLSACGEPVFGPTPTSEPTVESQTGGEVGDQAPEFAGIANWINSDALSMEQLRGDVVLVDFWTYTCVNCIRTFPFLREWHEKYADQGLRIVGVHSPEFEFEKNTENVVEAAEEFGLTYPIAQDNDFETWRQYANSFWPAKYLIDQEGVVRYTHFGEGKYIETEEEIRALLAAGGADLSGIPRGDSSGPSLDIRALAPGLGTRITREIYGGWRRNAQAHGLYIGQDEYYTEAEIVQEYEDSGDHANNFMYLQGQWHSGLEAIRHARVTEEFVDYIALKFSARSVNAVVHSHEPGESFEVEVTVDGRPLREHEAGEDVVVEDGRSYFVVDEPRMYQVVSLPEYDTVELKLSAKSDAFALYAFTFGAYEEVP